MSFHPLLIGGYLFAADHSVIDFRLIPCHRGAHPALYGRLQLGIVSSDMKGIMAVDDFPHQRAQLGIIDTRDLVPGDVLAVRVNDEHIGIVAGPEIRVLRMCALGLGLDRRFALQRLPSATSFTC